MDERTPSTGPLRTGDLFAGRYQVVKLLGKGGFGYVYLVKSDVDWELALKIMLPEYGLDERFRTRFIREMDVSRLLRHENGVPIRDAGVHEGTLYYTMEYIAGETVRQAIASDRSITATDLIDWGVQVLGFLEDLHSRNHLHRDLKPDNLMLERGTTPERVRVLDLGIARAIQADQQSDLTGPNPIGTPAYMAPEHLLGEPYDQRIDTYALGVILYECARGTNPFRAETPQQTVHRVLSQPMEPITTSLPGFPRDLDQVILRACDKDAGQRYASAAQFASDLERCRGGMTLATTAPYRPKTAEPKHRRRKLPWVAGVVAVALLAFLVWFLQGEEDPPERQAHTPEPPAGPAPNVTEDERPSQPDPVVPAPTPLVATIQRPAQGKEVGASVELEIELDGEPPFEIVVNGRALSAPSRGAFIESIELAEEGACTIDVTVTDAAGSTEQLTRAVISDRSAPEIETRQPETSPYYTFRDTTEVEVRITATEDLGPTTSIDGKVATLEDPRTATAVVQRGSEATRDVEVALVDRFGNQRTLAIELVRSRIPEGMVAIPDHTARDPWGSAWATPIREPRTGIVLLLVPSSELAGQSLLLGAVPGDAKADASRESPRLQVDITRPFYLGETEVSCAQWDAARVISADVPELQPPSWREPAADWSDHPAVRMRWEHAKTFCKTIGMRLPTEAEWEWVARLESASQDDIYPWGEHLEAGRGFVNVLDHQRAVHLGLREDSGAARFSDGFVHTAPTGAKDRHGVLGFRNLIGNVIEWCEDAHTEDTYQNHQRSQQPVPHDRIVVRDAAAAAHMGRGGSFKTGPEDCRISRRFALQNPADDVGLRVALDVPTR